MENTQTAEKQGIDIDGLQARETEALYSQCVLSSKEASDCFLEVLPMLSDRRLQMLVRCYCELFEKSTESILRKIPMPSAKRQECALLKNASQLSAQVRLAFRSDTETLAALLFDACHFLTRNLYAVLHRLQSADGESRRAVCRLIGTAEDFRDELKDFL